MRAFAGALLRRSRWLVSAAALAAAYVLLNPPVTVRLRGVNLSDARFEGVRLSGADLTRTELKSTLFDACRLDRAVFGKAWAPVALFQHTDLRGADFDGANLQGALFAACNLREARFRNAKLEACTFEASALDGVDLAGAVYDSTTTWPAGFDPEAHGAVRVPVRPRGIELPRLPR